MATMGGLTGCGEFWGIQGLVAGLPSTCTPLFTCLFPAITHDYDDEESSDGVATDAAANLSDFERDEEGWRLATDCLILACGPNSGQCRAPIISFGDPDSRSKFNNKAAQSILAAVPTASAVVRIWPFSSSSPVSASGSPQSPSSLWDEEDVIWVALVSNNTPGMCCGVSELVMCIIQSFEKEYGYSLTASVIRDHRVELTLLVDAIACGDTPETSYLLHTPAQSRPDGYSGMWSPSDLAAIPLLYIDINVDVIDLAAKVTMKQKYLNHRTYPIEAVFSFPIDVFAAICEFTVTIGDRTITGIVEEKEKAAATYSDALAAGNSAFLLEQKTEELFEASVGNLAPGEEALLTITYVTDLKLQGSDIRFFIPTTYFPRYNPSESTSNAVAAQEVSYPISIHANIHMPTVINLVVLPAFQGVTSPVEIDLQGHDATVNVVMSAQKCTSGQDFVMIVRQDNACSPRVWLERDSQNSDSVAAMLAFFPSLSNCGSRPMERNLELIFLVDRSGSMGGDRISYVTVALEQFVRSMPESCFFNIVGFGSSFQKLFQWNVRADEVNRNKALKHIQTISADMGGTEIFGPMSSILQEPIQKDWVRNVFLLTDGDVGNADTLTDFVASNNQNLHLYTLGIGSGVSQMLINALATAGNGYAEFVSAPDEILPAVQRQLARALQPDLLDVSLVWNTSAVPVHTVPKQLPLLFDHTRLLVFALFKTSEPLCGTVTLRATTASNTEISFPLTLNENQFGTKGRLVHTLAVRDLLKTVLNREQAVTMAKNYTLASKYTSFVCVLKRDGQVSGTLQLERIPMPVACNDCGRISIMVTGAVSWRAEGCRYKKNSIAIDVREEEVFDDGNYHQISGKVQMYSNLSGMPDLSLIMAGAPGLFWPLGRALKYHSSVRSPKRDRDTLALSLVPPDGECDLVTYRLEPAYAPFLNEMPPPLKLSLMHSNCSTSDTTGPLNSVLELKLVVSANFLGPDLIANNVIVVFQGVTSDITTTSTVSKGKISALPERDSIEWNLGTVMYNTKHWCTLSLSIPSGRKLPSSQLVSVTYEIPDSASSLYISGIKIVEKTHYQVTKIYRSITKGHITQTFPL
ncbi:Vault protein inter-alpha-trypsin domain [Pelomyxa schiedti]|nr:Vault protein inter-alpha-trypsin domain [Pelomyxa schiedti]